ncbi:putative phosphatase regulatory subunit-domain-containing protein [Cladorrhinum sp. PSN259]|nr:putative phosphatase regulatory subunit-domain-containing protein [Cladorrhinum sp. PSN259]
MPYTPPSHRSPAPSVPASPDGSRRPSFHQSQSPNLRPVLPRSASYLTKQRRTQPAQRPTSEPSPQSTSDDLVGMALSTSVRQSPPPVTGERRMPNGAIISPPESSDDDDLPQIRAESHGRKIENLKELQVAISQIPQSGPESPVDIAPVDNKSTDAGDLFVLPAQATALAAGMHHSLSSGSLDGLSLGGTRKFSHSRSHTEPHIVLSKSANSSAAGSDDEDDGERLRKPAMVRKKSGELVRPALRPPSRRRPSSMPGTPTFSKAVHFDSHLEHVRHFLQVDRPLAVSAGSSPIDNYDSDAEYPFSAPDKTTTRATSFEWEILTRSFPVETPARRAQMVRLERIWLSNDQKNLVGSIVVANIAFQKHVTCRFTLDYWKTTSEVVAEWASSIQHVDTPYPQDKFNFSIKLSDLANLETKTLYFCVRYSVNGQEYWDNNNGANFQADFKKKVVSQNGKVVGGARTVTGLPKSNRRPAVSASQRPKPKSGDSDAFGAGSKFDFEQSIDDYLGDSRLGGVRLKGVKSSANLPSDNLSSRLSAPSGQAFANRYDFGASLTAAIQTAKDQMGSKSDGGLYMKPLRKLPVTTTLNTKVGEKSTKPVEKPIEQAPKVKPAAVVSTAPAVSKPSTLPGTDSPGTSIASASYEEIVNKYCFYGTKQMSPVHKDDNTSRPARFDGVDDGLRTNNSNSSTSSYEGSPVQMGNYRHAHSGTQHHSLYHRDPNPYFQHIPPYGAMGASPAESPIMGYPVKRTPSPVKNQTAVPPTSGQQNGFASSSPPMVGNFAPFAGTSPNEYSYQNLHGRFPFSGADAHSATAIRG